MVRAVKTYMYCGNENSEGGKALAKGLGIKRIKHRDSRFEPSLRKTVINWGSCALPYLVTEYCPVFNEENYVALISHKLEFFNRMSQFGFTPLFETGMKHDAALLFNNEGDMVVCRTILNGHGGQGIVIATCPEELVEAPLYVQYIKKAQEYRVHIIDNTVVDVQRKIKDPGQVVKDWHIRNYGNGFIYVRNAVDWNNLGESYNKSVKIALDCFKESGLDFGAVDVIYNEHQGRAYVLEINTAPGLVGTTLDIYVEAFKEMLDE